MSLRKLIGDNKYVRRCSCLTFGISGTASNTDWDLPALEGVRAVEGMVLCRQRGQHVEAAQEQTSKNMYIKKWLEEKEPIEKNAKES